MRQLFDTIDVLQMCVFDRKDCYAGRDLLPTDVSLKQGCAENRNLFGFGFYKTEPSKKLTPVLTVFR